MTFICGIRLSVFTMVVYDSRIWHKEGNFETRGEIDKRDSCYYFDLFSAFDYDGNNCYNDIISACEKLNIFEDIDNRNQTTTFLMARPFIKKLNHIISKYRKDSYWGLCVLNSIFFKTINKIFGRIIKVPKPSFFQQVALLVMQKLGFELYIKYPNVNKIRGLILKFELLLELLCSSIIISLDFYRLNKTLINIDTFLKDIITLCGNIFNTIRIKSIRIGETKNLIDFPFRVLIILSFYGRKGLFLMDNRNSILEVIKKPGTNEIEVNNDSFKTYWYNGEWVGDK